jgi:hypothetical protein
MSLDSCSRWRRVAVVVPALLVFGLAAGREPGGQAVGAPATLPVPRTASVVLGQPDQENGLHNIDNEDGHTVATTLGGESARATTDEAQPTYGRYIYFGIDDSFAYDGYYHASLTVQYWDDGTNSFGLQYDSANCTSGNPAFQSAGSVTKTNTGAWKTTTFDLPDAHFGNVENGGSDFRLASGVGPVAGALAIHEVTLTILADNTPQTTVPQPEPGLPQPATTVTLQQAAGEVTLDNGYVQVGFNLGHPQIDLIRADFTGRARYAADLTATGDDPLRRSGIVLERDDPDGTAHASSAGPGPDLSVAVLSDTPSQVSVRIDGIIDDRADPTVTSSWTLSLAAGQRDFTLTSRTRALRSGQVADVHLAGYWSSPALYAWFDRGVEQMLNNSAPYFASDAQLRRFYAIGSPGGGAIDMTGTGQRQTVLRSAASPSVLNEICGRLAFYRSGVEQVLAGKYPTTDQWNATGWAGAQPIQLAQGQTWDTSATVAVNNRNFPDAQLASPQPNLPDDDLAAMMTGIYGTDAGMLNTYALPGEAAPQLAIPDLHYGQSFNFFDPDSYFITSALLYSGDSYLQSQARTVIEKSGRAILPSGQIPHHFIGDQPTYVAISGATQTGPNIFWIEAALQYAAATGDQGWLRTWMPTIEHALAFLTNRYDPTLHLVDAPGSLWIDTFIRQHYTSDTNAFMVKLLRDVADAEQWTGTPTTATAHRATASAIVAGMNAHLWAGDHYITQLNPDGTTRDFVDYDANLLAVAFGVAPPDRVAKIISRVDSGECTHADPAGGAARPTWVSEKTYGPDDTVGGNTGDSAVTMGRIGWADGLARKQTGDLTTFDRDILGPVETLLNTETWLTERFDCAGNAIHTPEYYEYPAMTVMLLREARYGINLGLGRVTINPWAAGAYSYHVGDVNVDYSSTRVRMTLPGTGSRNYEIDSLIPNASYHVVAAGPGAPPPTDVSTDAAGTLRFTAPIGPNRQILALYTAPR